MSGASSGATLNQCQPDAAINSSAAIGYWSSVSPDNNGMLGGFRNVSRPDLQGSANFLAKLRLKSNIHPRTKRLKRVVDCGAGVGRITKGFLSNVAEIVDIVEPVKTLTDVITDGDDFKPLRDSGRLGTVYNQGLEDWTPSLTYDLFWNQWCLGQLNDIQLSEYLTRIKPYLSEGGWIVVKENISTDLDGMDIFDPVDSSVTRTDKKLRYLFELAGLKIIRTELQRGLPKELYPVMSFALQPK